MLIYFSLIAPLILGIILFSKASSKENYISAALQTGITLLVCWLSILLIKYCAVKSTTNDTEYWGSYITKATRYEHWSTWKDETCYRSVPCGTDSKGNTTYCQEPYDCSYCDEHPEKYYMYDNLGNDYEISHDDYYALMKRWETKEKFVELNRNIDHHWNCGIDGDAYDIFWNLLPETSENISTKKTYENKLQACHTLYDYEKISKEEAANLHLYDYPPILYYQQENILGFNYLNIPFRYEDYKKLTNKFKHLNGLLGGSKEAKIFFLIFINKPIDISFKQQAYWCGGNKNEINICMGYNRQQKKLDWVRVFTWCEDKNIEVRLREDLMELNTINKLNIDTVYTIVKYDVEKYYHRRHFKDFNYLNVDVPVWANWLSFTFVLIITITSYLVYLHNINKYI